MLILRAVLAVAVLHLFPGQPLRPVASFSLFSVERKAKEKLRHSVCKAEKHRLEAKYGPHSGMGEDLANLLCPESGLWKVRVVDDDAPDVRFQCRPAAHA